MKYRKYDPLVKKMIIETGNRNLLPNLNIPRTTINYWLKSSKSPRIDSSSIYEETISKLKKDNFKLKAKKLLVVNC